MSVNCSATKEVTNQWVGGQYDKQLSRDQCRRQHCSYQQVTIWAHWYSWAEPAAACNPAGQQSQPNRKVSPAG